MWWLPRTSGYSYPRVTVILIDVHHVGENRTNTTRMIPTPIHVRPAYASCGQSLYMVTFCETATDLDRSHCSREKWLLTQSTAHRLTDPWVHTQLLSRVSQWRRGRKPSSHRWPTTRFTGLISLACDRYVQYLLTGANPSVLNRHRRGLQPWRCQLATYQSLTFPTSCLPFPLKAPPGLRLSTQHLPTELEREQALNLVSGSLHSISTVTYHLSIAWANDVPPR
jgi:hypothetical protein